MLKVLFTSTPSPHLYLCKVHLIMFKWWNSRFVPCNSYIAALGDEQHSCRDASRRTTPTSQRLVPCNSYVAALRDEQHSYRGVSRRTSPTSQRSVPYSSSPYLERAQPPFFFDFLLRPSLGCCCASGCRLAECVVG